MNNYDYLGNVVLSVSGGRTSGAMLYGALNAHGWELPPTWQVCFANTGEEREETLRFVDQMAREWGVDVVWIEWRPTAAEVASRPALAKWIANHVPHWTIDDSGFEIVGPNSASRNGEPFEALIRVKNYLPNAVTRFCTEYLKVKSIKAYLLSLGWTEWTNLVGLRHDEGHRILKRLAKEDSPKWKEPYRSKFPLDRARVTKADVAILWGRMSFDLGIASRDGNCKGCFLLSMQKLMWRQRQTPGALDFLDRMESHVGARCVTEYSYADLKRWVKEQPLLIEPEDDGDDNECSDACEAEAA